MSKDNGKITIDKRVQELILPIRKEIVRLQQRLSDILSTAYFQSGKKEDYKPNRDFTALELIKDDKEK